MARYIDADKIEIRVSCGINDNGLVFIPLKDVHASIDRTPTADVVEVVRCKDCKHYRDWGDCTTCMLWTVDYDVATKPNGFCSYGERKE